MRTRNLHAILKEKVGIQPYNEKGCRMISEFSQKPISAKCKNDGQYRQEYCEQSTNIFDWSPVRDFSDGDMEMQRLLLKIFSDNLEQDLADLEKSFAADNFEDWDGFAHKLHGSCAHMGAMSMAEACGLAQYIDRQERQLMNQLHHSILKEYRKVRTVLQSSRVV